MSFSREGLAQVMISILNMILLKNTGEVSEMFERFVPQNQNRHPATVTFAKYLKHFRESAEMYIMRAG
jgi:hypothetical protein